MRQEQEFNHHPHISTDPSAAPLNVVLFEPEIPANTGNISRTCATTGTALHLIEPLGFDIDDRAVRRAGLDYWGRLDLHVYPDWQSFIAANPNARLWLLTTKGDKPYHSADFRPGDFLVFGKETAGLPDAVHAAYPDSRLRIPLGRDFRSLNLSNAVAIVLFEALRQNAFFDLE